MGHHGSPWANDLALSLQRMGHEIHVLDFRTIASGGMPTNMQDTVDTLRRYNSVQLVERPRSPWMQHVALVRPLRRLARHLRPDLVLCLYGGRYALSTYLAGVRPYVVYVVGSDVLLASPMQRWINRFTLSAATLVLANGEHLAQEARRQAPRARVERLLMGVDVELLRPRRRHGVARIFNHRTFSATYNNETIIRALARLPGDTPAFEMVFASGGPELADAIACADSVLPGHLRSHVAFWRGEARREHIMDELARADFYVSMARSDGTATSVLEAMSYGVFPILSDIPANKALIDTEAGIGALVPSEDADALAGQLRECLCRVDHHRQQSLPIRNHVRRFADAAVNRAQLAAHLLAAAEGSRRLHP
jgi:glycosyltransferase involved in cell wall biosynthesis